MNIVEAMFIGETATEHYLWLELTGSRACLHVDGRPRWSFTRVMFFLGVSVRMDYYYEEPGLWSRKGRDVDHHSSSPCQKEDDVVHTAETMLHQDAPDFM